MERRHFLHNLAHVAAAPTIFSSLAFNTLDFSGNSFLSNTIEDGKIIVIIRMDGGNDGLNTVIPLDQMSELSNARPHVILPENKIISLGGDVKEQFASNISTRDAPFIQRAGLPIGTLYGYVEDGYFDNEAEVRNSLVYNGQPSNIIGRMIGEIKYRNFDNDPTSISVNDRVVIGDVNPDYTFGFTNNFKYKSFDLSIFINGVQGNDIVNMNSVWNANIGTSKNVTLNN